MNIALPRALLLAFGAGLLIFRGGACAQEPPTPLVLQAKIGTGADGSIVKNGDGSFTVVGGGVDIWDASDQFTFHYMVANGDFDVKVRVESFEPASRWSKAGLMARESLAPDSRMAFAYVEPPAEPVWAGGGTGANDAAFGYRTGIPGAGSNGGQHGDPSTGRPAAGYPNAWLRLRRTGDQVTAYHGTTGSNWVQLGTQDTAGWQADGATAPLSQNILLGFGVTPANVSVPTARAEFREFEVDIASGPPEILVQPATLSVSQGQDADFNVTARGAGPLAYQWRLNNAPLTGSTNRSLTLTNVQPAQAGDYTVAITNALGAITSAPAMLTVVADTNPPTVVQALANITLSNVTIRFSERILASTATVVSNYVPDGGFSVLSASLDATASNVLLVTTPLAVGTNYTLRLYGIRDVSPGQNLIVPGTAVAFQTPRLVAGKLRADFFVNIPGNRVSDLTNHPRFPASPDETRLVASFETPVNYGNNYGARITGYFVPPTNGHYTFYLRSDDSSQLFLSPDADPAGKVMLAREDGCCRSYGASGGFGTANDLVAGTFYYMEGLLKEATGGDYLLVAVTAAGAPVPDDSQVIPSAFLAVLTDTYPPVITLQPHSQTVSAGSMVTLAVGADGAAPLGYQWRLDDTDLPGQTNSALTFLDVQPTNAGNYTVRVQNADGFVISSAAVLTVIVPPTITAQPQSVAAAVGSNALFTVAAGGSVPFTYQWLFNGTPLPGATAAALALTNVHASNAGPYRVYLSYSAGSVTSSVATLTVYTNYGRFLRLASTNATAGATLAVPVMLSAQGDENGLGFSVGYDATVMTVTSAVAGNGAPGATLNLNTNQTASGRLGLTLVLPAGTTFAVGTQEVVVLTFAIAPASGDLLVPLTFLDQPVTREVSDVLAEPLSAVYFNGSLNIGGGIEGDVTPLPNGNGVVTATDWVKIGRYSAGLDTAPNGIQFQRADCAPRSTAGGGTFTVSDWVQAGRYVAALDPPTPAAGPTLPPGGFAPVLMAGFSPINRGGFFPASANRTVLVSSQNVQPGQTFQAPLLLEACGGESAMSLSLSFDRQWLEFTGFTPGTNATGATLNVNASQADAGRLGIGFSLPVGNSFPAGTRELARFNFRAVSNSVGSTTISFSDQPVPREISDALANALAAAYVGAQITIGAVTPQPLRLQPPQRQPAGHYRLIVGNADGSSIVSNRLSRIDVMTATNVGLTFSTWLKLTNTPVLTNGILQLDDGASTNFPRRFYRAVER